jgi:sulfur carrier protein
MNTLSLNGQALRSDAADLQALLLERGYDLGGAFACALNRVFVPRHHWPQQGLRDGDCIDLITPVTGG